MSRSHRVFTVVGRWLGGTAIVTWRYLWETTPLHRGECRGDEKDDRPPPIATEVLDDRVQRDSDGYGQLFHRRFDVRIAGAELGAEQLMSRVARDFKHFVPTEVVDVHADGIGPHTPAVGDELLVEMPGPWNGPVRVARCDDTLLCLVTLSGHMEAGQVMFRAREDDDLLLFEIELWARPCSRLVHVLYARLRLAKEIQLNMWVRFCLAVVEASGGRLVDGVHVSTRWLDPSEDAAGSAAPAVTAAAGRVH